MLIKVDARRSGKTRARHEVLRAMIDARLNRGHPAKIVLYSRCQVSVITHFIDPVSKLAYATEKVIAL